MRISLLENQVDIILKSLENYTKINPEKIQLIYATYESLLSQKCCESKSLKRNKNVILNFKKVIDK